MTEELPVLVDVPNPIWKSVEHGLPPDNVTSTDPFVDIESVASTITLLNKISLGSVTAIDNVSKHPFVKSLITQVYDPAVRLFAIEFVSPLDHKYDWDELDKKLLCDAVAEPSFPPLQLTGDDEIDELK